MTDGSTAQRLDPATFPLWGSRLIEASAGTGKTWTIAALYLRLVLGHGDASSAFGGPLVPSQILVMTFTRAATRELSDRVRGRLVDAVRCFRAGAADPDDALMAELIATFPTGPARDAAAWRLAMAAESMDDAAIFTIDAWVQRMLREHAFDSGSLFDEAADADEAAMLAEAARDYWRQEVYPLAREALDGVTAVWADVDRLTADMRVLARHADADLDPQASLASIWQRSHDACRAELAHLKAGWSTRARAMREWIAAGLADRHGPFDRKKMQARWSTPWLDVLDGWAAEPDRVALELPDTARHRLSADGIAEALRPGHAIDVPPGFAALPALLDALADLPDPSVAMRRHAATRIAARLRTLKHRAASYGFDDLLHRLDDALAGPSGERLRERIVAQYPVALIDEFQDTSPVQYRLFDRLYRTADNDRPTALLLIGDPKQSIYGFRGADIQSYLRAREATAGRHYLLTTNYRSTTGLVGAINHLFARAEGRGAGAFRFGAADVGGPLPFVEVEAAGRREVLRDTDGPVPAMTIVHDALLGPGKDTLRRFADRCAEHVSTTLADPHAGFVDPVDGFRHVEPADITILVRRSEEAVAVRGALQRRSIRSVYLSDQESVFASAEAADLLMWMRAVADPADSRRVRLAFATALVGLSLAEMAKLGHDDVVFDARVAQLKALHDEWRRQGVLPMLRRTLHVLDLPARWLADHDDGERKLTNVLHLAELLQAASAGLDGEQALIRWFATQLGEDGHRSDEQIVRLESDADLVRVVTVHKAKGLEYPIVYLPFVSGYFHRHWNANAVALLPDATGERRVVFDVDDDVKRRAALEGQQEELRLLYVALTRARHALWLGVAPMRDGLSERCGFHRSAFGYLVSGDDEVSEDEIAGRLHAAFDGVPSIRLVAADGAVERTRLRTQVDRLPLLDAPGYTAAFERDWSIGSFSAFVRDLSRLPASAVPVGPAVEEELLAGPVDDGPAVPSNAPRHRFPRGAIAGNFLHDQLEWLATQRFALTRDASVREQLIKRCERQGWGHRGHDVATWMAEVLDTPLPPFGIALAAVPNVLPEMEFWFPSDGLAARRIDQSCRRHLLGGRDRPALPDRVLRGMLMGFADLVCEVDGRYWVVDYKSNALGADDVDYTRDALERSMADHRYDVQAAIYLVALHRLLRQRLGEHYDPVSQLGGAVYLFLRGIRGPEGGCFVIAPDPAWLDALDAALGLPTTAR